MEKRIIKLGAANNCTPYGNTYEDYLPEEQNDSKEDNKEESSEK